MGLSILLKSVPNRVTRDRVDTDREKRLEMMADHSKNRDYFEFDYTCDMYYIILFLKFYYLN